MATNKVHHFFDLFEYINSIPSPEVAAQVAQSVAFRVDVTIISAARALYKDIREELFNAGIDVRAELSLALNQKAYAETAFYENGSTATGPVCTIKQLMAQREMWHGLAKELTQLTYDWKGVPRTYVEKDIVEQILEPGAMKVSSLTKAKHMKGAKRSAEALGAPEHAELLYAKRIQRSEQRNADMLENLRDQAQGVVNMFELALSHPMDDPSGATTAEFRSLPLDTRRMLINAAITAAERAEEWAAEDRNMTDTAYDVISIASMKAIKDLRTQLTHPDFVIAARQAEAAESMTG